MNESKSAPEAIEQNQPPLVCDTCFATQVFHEFDTRKDAFYCPHYMGVGVYALRNASGTSWTVHTGINPATHRIIVSRSERGMQRSPAARPAPWWKRFLPISKKFPR